MAMLIALVVLVSLVAVVDAKGSAADFVVIQLPVLLYLPSKLYKKINHMRKY